MKPLIAAAAVLTAIWGVYEFGVVRPAEARLEQTRLLMAETLPTQLNEALDDVRSVTDDPDAIENAAAFHLSALPLPSKTMSRVPGAQSISWKRSRVMLLSLTKSALFIQVGESLGVLAHLSMIRRSRTII